MQFRRDDAQGGEAFATLEGFVGLKPPWIATAVAVSWPGVTEARRGHGKAWKLDETCELQIVAVHLCPLSPLCFLTNLIVPPPGGRLVYSTCSLNPIENEAVVQAALLRFGPELSLLPAEDVLPPGCPRGSPGLDDWFVPDPSFESTAMVHHEVGHLPAPLEASMFATPQGRQLHLQRCARFWPIHGPYFGGFFLAAFAKTASSAPTKPLAFNEFTPHFVNVAESAPDTGF